MIVSNVSMAPRQWLVKQPSLQFSVSTAMALFFWLFGACGCPHLAAQHRNVTWVLEHPSLNFFSAPLTLISRFLPHVAAHMRDVGPALGSERAPIL